MQNCYETQTNRFGVNEAHIDGMFEKGLNETFESIHE